MNPVRRRLGLLSLTYALVLSVTGPALAADTLQLARCVPADVEVFIELHGAADLLVPLTEPHLWLGLAELGGQPARPDDAEQWRARIREAVGMEPAEAIRELFTQDVAYVAERVSGGGAAVVICRPHGNARQLINRWPAKPLPTTGRTALYRLPYNLSVALHGDLLIFGETAPDGGLFQRVLDLLDQPEPATLAQDATFLRLLQRVPADPAGVLFARLAGPPTTQPTTNAAPVTDTQFDLPRILFGSRNVLLALHRDRDLLHITAVGDTPGSRAVPSGSSADLVRTLPERTLFLWAGHVDYGNLAGLINTLPERHVLRVAYTIQTKSGTIQNLLNALGDATAVAVGVVTPAGRNHAAPPVPAVALLINTRNAEQVQAEWQRLVQTSVSLYKLLALKFGHPPVNLSTTAVDVGGHAVTQLDLTPLLGMHPERSPFGELHLSWTIDRDVLIVATHTDWLRQILAARDEQTPRLAPVLALAGDGVALQRDTLFLAQPGPLADLGAMWLEYFEQRLPFLMNEEWWRHYQPGRQDPRIGVNVLQESEQRRLHVTQVTPHMPSDGILRVGDYIVGCNRLRFTTDEPIREIAAGLATRPNARWIDLIIERDQVVLVKRIPLPFVDPVQLLQRLVAFGQLVQRVVYCEDVPDPDGPRGHLTLQLRRNTSPLYVFEASAPPAEAGGK